MTQQSSNEPLFLVGQLLAPGEPRAAVGSLPRQQRQALELCLSGERLDYRRRNGWRHPTGSIRIADSTMSLLESRGLLVIIRRSQFTKHARLTKQGAWYARTLITKKMETVQRICAEQRGSEEAI